MAADYIPEKDGDAAVWMSWFAYYIAFRPDAYRTTPVYAEQLVAVAAAYSAAFMDASHPGNKCKSLVWAKNDRRREAERLIRPEAQRIRVDPQIPIDMKVLIGIAPRARRRRVVPVPESVPVLIASSAMSGVVTLKVSDSQRMGTGKPPGAKGMELYERITPRATLVARANGAVTPDEGTWRFIGTYTRTPIKLVPKLGGRGDQVSYVGRWVTARGHVAKFGDAVSIYPHFNLVSAATFSINRERRAVA